VSDKVRVGEFLEEMAAGDDDITVGQFSVKFSLRMPRVRQGPRQRVHGGRKAWKGLERLGKAWKDLTTAEEGLEEDARRKTARDGGMVRPGSESVRIATIKESQGTDHRLRMATGFCFERARGLARVINGEVSHLARCAGPLAVQTMARGPGSLYTRQGS
jgi:hypothetical protein